MWTYQAFIALQTAEERVREADDRRLAALARSGRTVQPHSIRRSGAIALASLSTAAARLARRLDGTVAEDLSERLGRDRLATHH